MSLIINVLVSTQRWRSTETVTEELDNQTSLFDNAATRVATHSMTLITTKKNTLKASFCQNSIMRLTLALGFRKNKHALNVSNAS